MQKQTKKLNLKNKPFKKKFKKVDALKNFLRFRKIFKHKASLLNPTFKKVREKNSLKAFSKIINIKIKPNNIFCTLIDSKKNKTLFITSAGKCKTKTSKKLLRFSSKIITQIFFEKIKKALKTKSILINIVGPKKIKRSIIEQFSTYFKNKHLIINVQEKKCFNGCRAQKKKRKKQKALKVFK